MTHTFTLIGGYECWEENRTVIAANVKLVYLFCELVLLYRLCSWHGKWETPLEVLHLVHVAGPEVLWRMQEQFEICVILFFSFLKTRRWHLFCCALSTVAMEHESCHDTCCCLSESSWMKLRLTQCLQLHKDLPFFCHRWLSESQVWCLLHKNSKISLQTKVRDLSLNSNVSHSIFPSTNGLSCHSDSFYSSVLLRCVRICLFPYKKT